MPESDQIVINTGPLIALAAALGNLDILRMYRRVWVPLAVSQEMRAGGPTGFAVIEFEMASWLYKDQEPLQVDPLLANSLDPGEAAVIQLALDKQVSTVCIDEATERRLARLSGLSVTGSVGLLLRAKREGLQFSMREAIGRMRQRGIWLSEGVVNFALTQAGEASA
jgi:predicted nucleic acid-binding protein